MSSLRIAQCTTASAPNSPMLLSTAPGSVTSTSARRGAASSAPLAANTSARLEPTKPPVGPVDARAPLLIGLAAWRSLREGRPVSVAEIEA